MSVDVGNAIRTSALNDELLGMVDVENTVY